MNTIALIADTVTITPTRGESIRGVIAEVTTDNWIRVGAGTTAKWINAANVSTIVVSA